MDEVRNTPASAINGDGAEEQEEPALETLVVDAQVEKEQVESLRRIKARRDNEAVRRSLDTIRQGAGAGQNLMPVLIEAAQARCTVGEIIKALADVFGRYDGAARW